ncbi:MAG: DUF1698 domain-containing protein [Pseudomonadota bacterium]
MKLLDENISPEHRSHILSKIKELEPWYHKISLGAGITTPGRDYDHVWDSILHVMGSTNYREKRVLDIASWDGKWAFEAEMRGASSVIASDARLEGFENLLFVRGCLDSRVTPLCNVPVQELESRLSFVGFEPVFDVVHHFGLLYHLRDPLLSLAQCRRVIAKNGTLLLETAFIEDYENSYMAFSGLEGAHHFYGISDTWAPTALCLREMLIRSFFNPTDFGDWSVVKQTDMTIHGKVVSLGRVVLTATPMMPEEGHRVDAHKVFGAQ